MSKLIAEGYRRLFKGKRFYVVLIVIMALAALIPVLNAIFEPDRELRGYADGIFILFSGQIPMFVSVAAGLLITQDFRNNTVRNKIIIGHSRTNIYLANLIMALTVMVIYLLALMITGWGIGAIFMDFRYLKKAEFILKVLMYFPIMITFTSLIVFICNSLRSTGGFVLALGMHYILNTVEPFIGLIKNGDVYDVLQQILPSYQLTLLMNTGWACPEQWPIMLLSCVGITLVSTALGVFVFNKSDLK